MSSDELKMSPEDLANQQWTILFECEAGNKQEIILRGHCRQEAVDFAELMDGTSPMYVYPPDENSPIGKCVWIEEGKPICGKPFKCKVKEE